VLLRTRLILIILAFCTLVGIGVLLAEQGREAVMQRQFDRSIVRDRGILWAKIIETLHQEMDDKVELLADNEEVTLAVVQRRGDRVRRLMPPLVDRMRDRDLAERVEIYDADGALMYSSLPSVYATPVVSPEAIQTTIREARRLRGIGNDAARNIAVTLAFPLIRGERVVGAASFAVPVARALQELGVSTGTQILLVNRRMRPLAGDMPAVWEPLAQSGQIDFAVGRQVLETPDGSYIATYLPVAADLGTLIGVVVMFRDATAELAEQARPYQLLLAVVFGIFLIGAGVLTWYLRRTLAPLSISVSALDALAEERTDVPLQGVDRDDELGRLARAVNRYRRHLRSNLRVRRSRERQLVRQESFIQTQMTALADTLDAEARLAVLRDLEAVQARSNDGMNDASGREDLTLLADAFETLARRVQDQQERQRRLVSDLQEALAEKEAYQALQRELEIGRRVQVSSLPPEFPAADDVQVYGHMDAAKVVGGDFYDVFFLDRDHLAVAIGDVAAKGVPAALFLTICRSLLRAFASSCPDPGACLTAVNRQLAQNNPETLFLTLCYGVLERTTGRFLYVTAGHFPPALLRGGEAALLPSSGGPSMALIEDTVYETAEVGLAAGDQLFLYTDGIIDCFNAENRRFGDGSLLDSLETAAAQEQGGTPRALVAGVIADLTAFVGGAEPEDDRTCLALAYAGRSDQGSRGQG